MEETLTVLHRKSFSGRFLPDQAPENLLKSQTSCREEGSVTRVASLTCGEGGGGEAAPGGILGCLQEHCVVCALRQTLQSDPRVLCIHDQLLWNKPGRQVEGSDQHSVERSWEGKPRAHGQLGQHCHGHCVLSTPEQGEN